MLKHKENQPRDNKTYQYPNQPHKTEKAITSNTHCLHTKIKMSSPPCAFSRRMLGLFLLGYVTRKARNVDAVLGVTCGVIVVVWMSLSPILFTDGFWSEYKSPFHANLTIVFGTMVIFLIGFVSTNLFKRRKS